VRVSVCERKRMRKNERETEKWLGGRRVERDREREEEKREERQEEEREK
jgi:hypothetical protein